MKRVVIYGLGRVGTALALGLKHAGWSVSVFARSSASRQQAKKLKLKLCDDLRQADLVVLSVPDRAVAHVRIPDGPAVVHCAGALPITAVHAKRRGSFHPLLAISSADASLTGGWVAISANDAKLIKLLRELAHALEMHPFSVPEKARAKYHAGAVMSAGLVVALIDVAVEATGLPRKEIEPALLTLTASALDGARRSGLKRSATGPIVRGDVTTVQAHLKALPASVREPYRVLSKRLATLTKQAHDSATHRALLKLLR